MKYLSGTAVVTVAYAGGGLRCGRRLVVLQLAAWYITGRQLTHINRVIFRVWHNSDCEVAPGQRTDVTDASLFSFADARAMSLPAGRLTDVAEQLHQRWAVAYLQGTLPDSLWWDVPNCPPLVNVQKVREAIQCMSDLVSEFFIKFNWASSWSWSLFEDRADPDFRRRLVLDWVSRQTWDHAAHQAGARGSRLVRDQYLVLADYASKMQRDCFILADKIKRDCFSTLPQLMALAKRAAFVGAGLLAVGTIGYMLYKRILDTRFAKVQYAMYDGSVKVPFCVTCYPPLRKTNLGSDFVKRFEAPTRCPRCSWVPFNRGWAPCEITISASLRSTLSTYNGLTVFKPRDVHSSFVNLLDSGQDFTSGHVVAQEFCGVLEKLTETHTWSWRSHTQSYRRATPWLDVEPAAEAAPAGAPPPAVPDVEPSDDLIRFRKFVEQGNLFKPQFYSFRAIEIGASIVQQALLTDEDEPPLPPPATPPPQLTHATPSSAPGAPPRSPPPPPPPTPPPPPPPPAAPPPPLVRPPGVFSQAELEDTRKRRALVLAAEVHDNQYPQLCMTACPNDRATHHTGADLPTRSAPVRALLSEIEPANYISPPPGLDAGVTFNSRAVVNGPIVNPSTVHAVHDKFHAHTAAEKRLDVSTGSDGRPLTFQPNSDTGRRFNKLWHRIERAVFTNDRIDEAFGRYFGSKELVDVHLAAFGEEEKQRAIDELLVKGLRAFDGAGARKANGKLEVVDKAEKPVRYVVDNGLLLLACSRVPTKVFEVLMNSKDLGVFHNMSIKETPRDEVLDRLVGELSTNEQEPMCGWEIDQTGMEKHVRCSASGLGTLAPVYRMLDRICMRVLPKLCAMFGDLYSCKLHKDAKTGMRITIVYKDAATPRPLKFTLRFADLYVDSGWSLTSGCNFAVELTATLSSCTSNPEHILAFNKQSKLFRVQDGTFDWTFNSVPMYFSEPTEQKDGKKSGSRGTRPSKQVRPIKFRGRFEGDDGGGAASRALALPSNASLISENYATLGLDGKWNTVVDGRLEFVGAHITMVDGRASRALPWVPDVKRSLTKLGLVVSANVTLESQVARFLSLAAAYDGKIELFHRAFMDSAQRLIDRDSSVLKKEVLIREYDDTERWLTCGATGRHKLSDLLRAAEERSVRPFPSPQQQLRMINCSVGKSPDANVVTSTEWAKFAVVVSGLRDFTSQENEAFRLACPAALQAVRLR